VVPVKTNKPALVFLTGYRFRFFGRFPPLCRESDRMTTDGLTVTQVRVAPDGAAAAAGRPPCARTAGPRAGARSPSILFGVLILAPLFDPRNLDRSLDSLFNMLDYGPSGPSPILFRCALLLTCFSLWLARLFLTSRSYCGRAGIVHPLYPPVPKTGFCVPPPERSYPGARQSGGAADWRAVVSRL